MFDTIIGLFTFGFWVVAIILFFGGIIMCIVNITTGSTWEKTMGVLAVILGIFTFFGMYAWAGSIAWCMMISGLVLVNVAQFGSSQVTPPKEPGPIEKFGDAYLEVYAQKKLMEEAFTDALRKSKE